MADNNSNDADAIVQRYLNPASAAPAASGGTSDADAIVQRYLAQPGAATPPPSQPPPPNTTLRGLGRAVGGALIDAAGNVISTVADLPGSVIRMGTILGGTAYDAAAPYVGLPRMSDALRNELYGINAPPEEQLPGQRVISGIDAAVGNPLATMPPPSPTERVVRSGVGAGLTAAALSANPLVAGAAGTSGGVTGDIAAAYSPEWLKPGAQLIGNVLGGAGVASLDVLGGGEAAGLKLPAGKVDPGKAALADTAINKYKIPVEASDLTTDPAFQRTGAASEGATAAKQQAVTSSVIKEMGESADRFSSQVMRDTETRTGKVMDDVATRNDINPAEMDNLTNSVLPKVSQEIDRTPNLTDGDRARLHAQLNDVVQAIGPNGTISGADYRSLVKSGSPLDRVTKNSNSDIANIGRSINEALDDAFDNSVSPADAAALRTARYQYRVMKTVEPLAAKSVDGLINPKELMGVVNTASRRFDTPLMRTAYTGGGNLGELARIGQMIDVTPAYAPKTSGFTKAAIGAGEAAAALAAAHYIDHPLAAGIPAAVSTAAVLPSYLRGRYLPSDYARDTMIRNALNPPSRVAPYAALFPSAVAGSNPLAR